MLIWRWRHDWSRPRAASALGLKRDQLAAIEHGRSVVPAELRMIMGRIVPTIPEKLRLARRRAGIGTQAIAAHLGISRMRLWKLEKAGDDRVIRFWKGGAI